MGNKERLVMAVIGLVIGLAIAVPTTLVVMHPMKLEAIRSALFIFDIQKNEWRALTTDDLHAIQER